MEAYISQRQATRITGTRSPADVWGPWLCAITVAGWGVAAVTKFEFGVVLLTAVAFLVAIIGLRTPSLGLIGVSMLATMDTATRIFLMTGGLFRFNTLNYLLLFVAFLHAGRLFAKNDLSTRLLVCFAGLLVVQLVYTPNFENGLQHVINMTSSLGIVVYCLRAANDERAWYWMALIGGVLGAGGGLIYHLFGGHAHVNYNAWSLFPLTAMFAVCLGFRFAIGASHQAALFILASVNGLWIYLSGSRGSTFTALCLLFVMILLVGSGTRRLMYISACIPVVALIFYKMSDLGASSEKRFDKLFDSSISYSQRTSGRSVLATGGWYLFLEHPLGVGTGGFSYSYATLDRENIDFHRGRRMQAHSGWIKTLAENGLPGIVLLVSYVWSFALRGWLRRKDGLFLIGLLPSVVLSITFLSTEFQGKGNWFLASAASVLLTRSRWSAATPQRTVRMPLFALRVDQRRIVPV